MYSLIRTVTVNVLPLLIWSKCYFNNGTIDKIPTKRRRYCTT